MDKRILVLVLVLVSMAAPATAMVQTQEEILNELNTPENVKLMSQTFDNRALLAEFFPEYIQDVLINNNAYRFQLNGTDYYFVKYRGLYTECSNCSQYTRFIISERGLRFVDSNQDLIVQVMKDGKVDWFNKMRLVFSAIIS